MRPPLDRVENPVDPLLAKRARKRQLDEDHEEQRDRAKFRHRPGASDARPRTARRPRDQPGRPRTEDARARFPTPRASRGRSPRGRRRRAVRGPRGGRARRAARRRPPAASIGRRVRPARAARRRGSPRRPGPGGAEPLEERTSAEQVEVGRVRVFGVEEPVARRCPCPARCRRSASALSRKSPRPAKPCGSTRRSRSWTTIRATKTANGTSDQPQRDRPYQRADAEQDQAQARRRQAGRRRSDRSPAPATRGCRRRRVRAGSRTPRRGRAHRRAARRSRRRADSRSHPATPISTR